MALARLVSLERHKLYKPLLSPSLQKFCSASSSSSRLLHCLQQDSRQMLQVKGADSSHFLQGLITNDMKHLKEGSPSMYTMILNSQGRVLYDVIIYNNTATDNEQNDDYFIEAEASVIENLARHLKMFRLRKKVEIDISNNMKCWTLFDPDIDFKSITEVDIECLYMNPKIDSKHELNVQSEIEGMVLTRDPRMRYLGHKLLLPSNVTADKVLLNLKSSDQMSYTNLRYRLGVGEGNKELPTGDVMPLEANVDYLHGISFHKGCYVGQELTARVFHTGVVRKRYMPIVLSEVVSSTIAPETTVVNSKGKNVGRMRAHAGQHGIALLRITDCLADPHGLSVAGIPLTTFKPAWWPIEASKQKGNA